MINPNKLFQLSPGQKRRKLALCFGSLERDIAGVSERGAEYNFSSMSRADYEKSLCKILLKDPKINPAYSIKIKNLLNENPLDELRLCNTAKNALLEILGTFPAEWDFVIAPHNVGGGMKKNADANFENPNCESANSKSANVETANSENADFKSANANSKNPNSENANVENANCETVNSKNADVEKKICNSNSIRKIENADASAAFLQTRNFFSGVFIYAEDIRSPFNLGSIFRTAEAMGAEKIFLSPLCVSETHPRASRSAMGCTKTMPFERVSLSELSAANENIFVLETGGTPIGKFDFPKRGVCIIGSEELGASPEALRAATCGCVSIPMAGLKASLNVGVALGILLQKWTEAIEKM